MTSNPTAYLICGPTAAGKSTYARRLAAEKNAVRFAIDEWMHALFAEDRPEKMDLAWVMSRVARCQSRIWATCTQILAAGTDVVLEVGLLREKDRDRMRSLVEAAGYPVALCFVDAEYQVRRQRVLHRNEEKGDTYSFEVTPAMFDAMERYFEPPGHEELRHSQSITAEIQHG